MDGNLRFPAFYIKSMEKSVGFQPKLFISRLRRLHYSLFISILSDFCSIKCNLKVKSYQLPPYSTTFPPVCQVLSAYTQKVFRQNAKKLGYLLQKYDIFGIMGMIPRCIIGGTERTIDYERKTQKARNHPGRHFGRPYGRLGGYADLLYGRGGHPGSRSRP